MCAVYVGHFDEPVDIVPHPEELDEWGWFKLSEVDEWVERQPEAFTPWFLMEWQALRGQYAGQLALYL